MQTLKFGSRGADVKTLQQKLKLYPDGIFGHLTEEAVRMYQKANGLVVDGIVGAKTWTKLLSDGTLKVSRRKITEIIIHCTATPEGRDYTVEQIRQWHLKRGFSDIGYHYVIYRDGSVHEGRSVDISGAHCTGHNYCSIGVCYVGGCPPSTDPKWMNKGKDTRTEAQKTALRSLVSDLQKLYCLGNSAIHGHNEFSNKPCPCFDVRKEWAR